MISLTRLEKKRIVKISRSNKPGTITGIDKAFYNVEYPAGAVVYGLYLLREPDPANLAPMRDGLNRLHRHEGLLPGQLLGGRTSSGSGTLPVAEQCQHQRPFPQENGTGFAEVQEWEFAQQIHSVIIAWFGRPFAEWSWASTLLLAFLVEQKASRSII